MKIKRQHLDVINRLAPSVSFQLCLLAFPHEISLPISSFSVKPALLPQRHLSIDLSLFANVYKLGQKSCLEYLDIPKILRTAHFFRLLGWQWTYQAWSPSFEGGNMGCHHFTRSSCKVLIFQQLTE